MVLLVFFKQGEYTAKLIVVIEGTVSLYLLARNVRKFLWTKTPPKLSYRSAFHKKVVFFAGSVWTLARTQGEVRGDQEPPVDTWRVPIPPKKNLFI